MSSFRKLMSDIADIRTAVTAAHEYAALSALPAHAAQRHEPLKAFMPV